MQYQRFNASTLQRFITRGLFCFDPASILRLYCLTLTFVFFGTVGAVAQTAVLPADQTVASGAIVVLDGSASTAPPGRTIGSYNWVSTTVDAGCKESPDFEISGSELTFTAETLTPNAADVTYCFYMKVELDNADSGPWAGPVRVTVSHSVAPPPPPADTTAPTGTFETPPATHDGKTPLDMAIVFSEPVTGFTIADVGPTALDFPPGTSGVSVRPTISNFRQDSTNELRYTFTVTPIAPYNFYLVSARKPPANLRPVGDFRFYY